MIYVRKDFLGENMVVNFLESSSRSRICLERALLSLDCGQIIFNKQFEICREKYEDSEEHLVCINNPLLNYFSKELLTEFESKKLYQQILQDVPAGTARILFKYPSSFEVVDGQ